jgi:hypothetical protein
MKEYLFSYRSIQKEKVQIELFGKILQGGKWITLQPTLPGILGTWRKIKTYYIPHLLPAATN